MYRASTRAFCEAKGRLYNLIKNIISAGQALRCHDPEAASQYNSKVLYRRTGKTESPEKKELTDKN